MIHKILKSWCKCSGCQKSVNVMHRAPGPTRFAPKNVVSSLTAIQLLIRSPMLKEILEWTNKEGSATYG